MDSAAQLVQCVVERDIRKFLSNNTKDTLDPCGSVEAARISGHCLKNLAHEVQVVDGLCPHGAPQLVSLSTVLTLRGHWRTTGCRELDPARRGSWRDGAEDIPHYNPKFPCSPATRVSRCFAKALQVKGSTTHTLEHQGLLAG